MILWSSSILGCRTKFNDDSIKLLDLTTDGKAILYAYFATLDVNAFRIISMNGIKVDFFEIKIVRVFRDARRWDFEIEVNIYVYSTVYYL